MKKLLSLLYCAIPLSLFCYCHGADIQYRIVDLGKISLNDWSNDSYHDANIALNENGFVAGMDGNGLFLYSEALGKKTVEKNDERLNKFPKLIQLNNNNECIAAYTKHTLNEYGWFDWEKEEKMFYKYSMVNKPQLLTDLYPELSLFKHCNTLNHIDITAFSDDGVIAGSSCIYHQQPVHPCDSASPLICEPAYMPLQTFTFLIDPAAGSKILHMDSGEYHYSQPIISANGNFTAVDQTFYSRLNGEKHALPNLDQFQRFNVTLKDISNNGKITGSSLNNFLEIHAFSFDPSQQQMTDIGTLGGEYSVGIAINTHGDICGESWNGELCNNDEDNTTHAFFWDAAAASMKDLGALDAQNSVALSVNEKKQAVGYVEYPLKRYQRETDAFIWSQNGGMKKLADCIDMNAASQQGWRRLCKAYKINNRGEIIGTGLCWGELHTFLLIPTTE